MQRVSGHWSSLPREVLTVPSLSEFKKCPANAHRPVILRDGAVQAQELGLVILVGPFQLGISCDSIITSSFLNQGSYPSF